MSLYFEEKLTGTVQTRAGERRFDLTVVAESRSTLALVGWAPFTLRGAASLEGAVERAPLLPGSVLEIGPPLHRYLRYQVHFRSREGDVYRLFGQKTVCFFRPARSVTTLEGTLFQNGVELGPVVLRLKLRDLPRLLGSFRTSDESLAA